MESTPAASRRASSARRAAASSPVTRCKKLHNSVYSSGRSHGRPEREAGATMPRANRLRIQQRERQGRKTSPRDVALFSNRLVEKWDQSCDGTVPVGTDTTAAPRTQSPEGAPLLPRSQLERGTPPVPAASRQNKSSKRHRMSRGRAMTPHRDANASSLPPRGEERGPA